MNEEERYLFDVRGFMVVEGAIPAETLSEMNAWIDEQEARDPEWRSGRGSLLTWGPLFRDLLDNPRVLPYLREILGSDLRLDHDYAIFSQAGGQGLQLHGGGTPYDPAQYYHCYEGRMYSGLAVASYALTDIPPGVGGFGCIPGSHKANFHCPDDLRHFRKPSAAVQQIPVNAGDCVLFTEALTHGTFPWTAAHQRRSLFLKYSPKHLSWANRYYFPAEGHPEVVALANELTEAQRILLDPPSVFKHRRLPE